MKASEGFSLMVHVPADEWAYCRRRVAYLEAVLIQVLKDRERIQEWYDAAELASLRLPGLPTTKAGITRMARGAGWRCRTTTGRGGPRFQYHYTSFPARAFDALVGLILQLAEPAGEGDMPPVPEIEPAPIPAPAEPDNTAPPWVLPFMRLLRGGADGDISAAWRALPTCLPAGVVLPTQEEAAETLIRLGLVK
jgi:hypothetical protein